MPNVRGLSVAIARRLPDINPAFMPPVFLPQALLGARGRDERGRAPVPVVALCYGSYRNLTTLTAAALGLHPHCAVLNHGALRILPTPPVNFLAHPTPDRYARFTRYALWLSERGQRGDLGGSIRRAHAFDNPKLAEIYDARFPAGKDIAAARAVFWKEPNRVVNFVERRTDGFPALLRARPEIRLVMPIRNPVHCTRSLRRTGHDRFLVNAGNADFGTVLKAVFRMIASFQRIAAEFPERCFQFTETEVTTATLERLARFLTLEAPPSWLSDVETGVLVRETKAVTPEEAELCEREIEDQLGGFPQTQAALRQLIHGGADAA